MRKEVIYRYLGTNGILDTHIHLEDIYYIRRICMTADEGKLLTNGTITRRTITVAEEDVKNWKEIIDPNGQ